MVVLRVTVLQSVPVVEKVKSNVNPSTGGQLAGGGSRNYNGPGRSNATAIQLIDGARI